MRFSERYGYIKPSDVIIREKITPEIENAICNCYNDLLHRIGQSAYRELERFVLRYYLNGSIEKVPKINLIDDFSFVNIDYKHFVILPLIKAEFTEWWKKIDVIEFSLSFLVNDRKKVVLKDFIDELNNEFIRLNFGYRIVKNSIISTTSDEEIETIDKALHSENKNVLMHLNSALTALCIRPIGDYRNSIKESISAVEALNREITGEKTLNFKKMETKGLKIPSVLRKAFEHLYGYTNDETTGIRHSLMDDTAEYVPGADEALYMLITCSAFINYLNSKLK